ncbi:MAG: SAM-dependent DNA methyltransferase [bacterium]|nr:SAM-dependent DNA methyltransferase [bacterium]
MEQGQLNWITNYIWGIADDVLRDLFVRGKYRDVILPMTVLRRLDAVLEGSNQAVLDMKASLDDAGVVEQDPALRQAAGQAFYNTSKFTLKALKSRASQQQLKADFEAYLDGFSPNVQDILENFEFRNQIPRLSKADALGTLIEKLTSPDINLSPGPVKGADGSIKHPGLDNHGMGSIFEELVRKFNEENNEEAGEHWTPRDAVKLMSRLIFLPIADEIESGTYLLYDGALGTGGMLTVAEETLQQLAADHGKEVATHLYGQEINSETYAICKADLLLKGEGYAADNIIGGPEHSTLANDAFPSREFDFMLSNPPYGKSWKTDLERMGGKKDMRDPRFVIEHAGDPEYSLVTRSSDGQMLFLANMLSKMKQSTELGSRIAEVHNGSSLFTGDAGQGESNIRRWTIENDWLEAIVALPLNMFYNTGIATYVWVLTNRKPEHRRGKVQLIDATEWYQPLRKNLGKKNCELGEDDIIRICDLFLEFKDTEQSKIFDNEALGYWKVVVDRPLRLKSQFTSRTWLSLQFASGDHDLRSDIYDTLGEKVFEDFQTVRTQVAELLSTWASGDDDTPSRKISDAQKKRLLKADTWERDKQLVDLAPLLAEEVGDAVFDDHNRFRAEVELALKRLEVKLPAASKKAIYSSASWRSEDAAPVVKKVHQKGTEADPLKGLFAITVDGEPAVVQYEPDTDLRDTEQIPLQEEGGVDAFLAREVLPHAPDAWHQLDNIKIGYEISFTRHFYKPKPMRTLEEIRADILALEQETEGLLDEIIGDVPK